MIGRRWSHRSLSNAFETCLKGPGCPDPLRQEKRGEGDIGIIAYLWAFASPNFVFSGTDDAISHVSPRNSYYGLADISGAATKTRNIKSVLSDVLESSSLCGEILSDY
jgi:hypothetical protein